MLRICIGLLVIAAAIQLWPDRFVWFGEHGLLPVKTSLEYNSVYTPLLQDNELPGVDRGERPINFLEYATQDWEITAFFVVYMIAAVCMTFGFCTRTSIFLVYIGLNCIHNRDSLNNTTGGDEIMLIMTIFLFMANSGGVASVDRLIRVWRGIEDPSRAPKMSIWPQRLMQIQVSIVYLCTFFNKLLGQMWMTGTAVYYPYQTLEFHRFAVPFMIGNHQPAFPQIFPLSLMNQNNEGVIAIMTYGTLAVELSMATLVWVPRLRLYVLTAGMMLHLGIEYAMNIPLFAFLMIASYISFLTPEDLDNFGAFLARTFHLTRMRVVFDGQCDFCRSMTLLLRSMDSLRLLKFFDYHRPEELRETPGVAFEDADQAVIAVPLPWKPSRRRRTIDRSAEWPPVDSEARSYKGFYAFRQIARRLPNLWLLVPFLFIPGVDAAGTGAYIRIAEDRRNLPVAPAVVKARQSTPRASRRAKAGGRK